MNTLDRLAYPAQLTDALIEDISYRDLSMKEIVDEVVEIGNAIKEDDSDGMPPAEQTYYHLAHTLLKERVAASGQRFMHYPTATRRYLGLSDES